MNICVAYFVFIADVLMCFCVFFFFYFFGIFGIFCVLSAALQMANHFLSENYTSLTKELLNACTARVARQPSG